eukprot:m.56879 g.56879  ORF g.56879 m.56879 type:complete len:74 (+) comp13419_c0_seq1:371-592(+)
MKLKAAPSRVNGPAVVGVMIGGLAVAMFFVVLQPMMNPDPYKQQQKETKATLVKEKMQPSGLAKWTDPFDHKK